MLKYHIQTIEVGSGGTTSVSFNNIPQTYDDLLLEVSARSGYNGYGQDLSIKFNSNSSSYSARRLYGQGSGTGSDTGSSTQFSPAAPITGATSTAGTFGNASIYISNYASSSPKAISSTGVGENNATNAVQAIVAGLWNDTSVITSIQCIDNSTLQQYSTFSLYGIKHGTSGEVEVASGGTISYSGGYTIHTFNSSGTFVANRDMTVEALVVGGGGGGGSSAGGGGGAGGLVATSLAVSSGTSSLVVVGAGGTAAINTHGINGFSSSALGVVALGGGGGAHNLNNQPGNSGGSGGGGASYSSNTSGGLGTSGQGNNGGAGTLATGGSSGSGGGGGGAGEAGNTDAGAAGGDGALSSISGVSTYYAGGGSGSRQSTDSPANPAGEGGGGTGGVGGSGTSGTANTGGGGGGGWQQDSAVGGSGGSGVVIIRYLTPA